MGIVGLALLLGAEARPSPHRGVFLVDDQGQPLTGKIELCLFVGLLERCETQDSGAGIAPADDVESIRIEAERYGPVRMRRAEWESNSGPIVVPRKASLFLRSSKSTTVALSLYSPTDPDLPRVWLRRSVPVGVEVSVPSGEHLVSVGASGSAPELRAVDLLPGSRHELSFVPRPGWSVVLRLEDAAATPVAEAQVRFTSVEGGQRAPALLGSARSDRLGLVLLSGVTDDLVAAEVEHPGFVTRRLPGLAGEPGSFAFQRARLDRGGTLKAVVRTERRPAAGALCQILAPSGTLVPDEEPLRLLDQGTTDLEGIWRSRRLATGTHFLRVSLPESPARADREALVVEGEEMPVEVWLEPISIHGEVRLGDRPAPGLRIVAHGDDARLPRRKTADAVATAVTNEEGGYDLTVWMEGNYSVLVKGEADSPVAAKRFEVVAPGTRVDFALDEGGVFGVVLDGEGRSVAGATVSLGWEGAERGSTRLTTTGEEGEFRFAMEGSGSVELRAAKEGYRPAESARLDFVTGRSLGPLTLVLVEQPTLRGRVVHASGSGVPEAWVWAMAEAPADAVYPLASTRTDDDGAFELQVGEGQRWVSGFVSGPGCPLTPFRVARAEERATLGCASGPATLLMRVVDGEGAAVPGADLILRRESRVLPRWILAAHLSSLGLPWRTDGEGRLVLARLAPGPYELFLGNSTNEELVAARSTLGFLGAFALAPGSATSVEVRTETDRPRIEAPVGAP